MRLKYNAELRDQLALCDFLCRHSPNLRRSMRRQQVGGTALCLLVLLLDTCRVIFFGTPFFSLIFYALLSGTVAFVPYLLSLFFQARYSPPQIGRKHKTHYGLARDRD